VAPESRPRAPAPPGGGLLAPGDVRPVAGSVWRVPIVGGLTAWHVPLVAATLVLGALGLGLFEMAAIVGGLGFVAQSLLRGFVVEIAPRGLTRGLALNGRFVGRPTVMAWDAVASVHTDWRQPGDDTALATTVRDGKGAAICFTTAMGLAAYWRCLAAVAAAAPAADRSGLTGAVLAGDPPGRRGAMSDVAVAGALALVLVGLVGMHYLLAQGRSSLSRALDSSDASGPATMSGR
jgi:hypothetical protein